MLLVPIISFLVVYGIYKFGQWISKGKDEVDNGRWR
jgi:hypothetical protein